MKTYRQLTQEQRYQIYALKKARQSQTEMARVVGVHKSTISRELKRNSGKRGYRPKQAQRIALRRRRAKVRFRISLAEWNRIDALIRQDWSPEQVSGRLRREATAVSHEWIYQHITTDKWRGGDLHTHLRCRKKRRKRVGSTDRRGQIPNRVPIDERPAVVDQRRRIGDWEADTIIGKNHRGALLSLVDRTYRFTLLAHTPRRTAVNGGQQMIQTLRQYRDRVHTITVDNGKEFAQHEAVAAE